MSNNLPNHKLKYDVYIDDKKNNILIELWKYFNSYAYFIEIMIYDSNDNCYKFTHKFYSEETYEEYYVELLNFFIKEIKNGDYFYRDDDFDLSIKSLLFQHI